MSDTQSTTQMPSHDALRSGEIDGGMTPPERMVENAYKAEIKLEYTEADKTVVQEINKNADDLMKRDQEIPLQEMVGHGIISQDLADRLKSGQLDPIESYEAEQLEIDYEVCKLLKDAPEIDQEQFWQYFNLLRGVES